jgi:hypothetical protein
MKTFKQFFEQSKIKPENLIRLGSEEQKNLNTAKKTQIGPGAKPVPHTPFRLEPLNIPMK